MGDQVHGSGPVHGLWRSHGDDVAAEQWCEELVARVRPGGLAPEASLDTRAPGLDSRYHLERLLGAGGMGEVWRARHIELDRDVAIKVLRPRSSGDPTIRQRFIREARLASAIRHPGIVDVLDFGQTLRGQPYLVMELLEGRSLKQHLEREGPISWPKARRIVLALCDALAHAHEHGVVHRDLKPSNIMLTTRPGQRELQPVLVDFGMAKGAKVDGETPTLTATGQVFGTPAYMSPEQFRGGGGTVQSDIYALGCVMFELLTATRPFAGASAAELMYEHLLEPFPKLPKILEPKALRRDADRILATACDKNPDNRYAEMRTFADAVARAGSATRQGRVRGVVGAVGGVLVLGAIGVANAPDSKSSGSRPVASAGVAGSVVVPPIVPQPRPRRIRSLHASSMFTCALSEDGAVQCWGKMGPHFGRPDQMGHVGDDERPSDVPLLDFGPRKVMSLAVSYWSTHLCALLDDGTARCWGDNSNGQLGQGAGVGAFGDAPGETPANAPALPLADIHAIYTQSGWTCALTGPAATREARCWGLNILGQLGQGHRRELDSPPDAAIDFGGAVPVDLALGLHHGCARFTDGTARCWGSNGKLQLGNGLPTDVHIGDGVDDGVARGTALPNDAAFDIVGTEGLEIKQLHPNGGWGCFLTEDGRIRCWGGNLHGCLGYHFEQIEGCVPDDRGRSCPISVPGEDVDLGLHGGSTIVDLHQGRQRSCALDDRGSVYCWGNASHGALGYGAALEEIVPEGFIGHRTRPGDVYTRLERRGAVDIGDFDNDGSIDRVRQLTVGYNHACVLVEDQSVRCWGGNDYGQLGYATLDDVGDDETPAEYYRAHGVGAVSIWPEP